MNADAKMTRRLLLWDACKEWGRNQRLRLGRRIYAIPLTPPEPPQPFTGDPR